MTEVKGLNKLLAKPTAAAVLTQIVILRSIPIVDRKLRRRIFHESRLEKMYSFFVLFRFNKRHEKLSIIVYSSCVYRLLS